MPDEENGNMTEDKNQTNNTQNKVFNALVAAIAPVIKEIKEAGDKEAMTMISPNLLVVAVGMMVQELGREAATEVVKTVSEKIEKGDFDKLFAQ